MHIVENSPKSKIVSEGKTQTATVIKCDAGQVVLSIDRMSSCSGCQQRNNCSHRSTERLLNQNLTLTLDETRTLAIGQSVAIDLDASLLLKSAFLVYCVPIFVLLFTAGICSLLTDNQGVIFVVSMTALLASFVCVKYRANRYAKSIMKQIKIAPQ